MTEPTPAKDDAQAERNAVEQIVLTKAYVEEPELLPWYTKELEEPKPAVRDLFESYSKVPPTAVVAHIKHVRDDAFKIVSPILPRIRLTLHSGFFFNDST